MANSTLPTTMRAWNFSTSGIPGDILSLHSAHPTPSPPTGSNLLIRVSYASLTSAGVNLMRDIPSILRKNAIPEMDFSGHVALSGPSADAIFVPGTRVFGTVNPTMGLTSGAGALAEYIIVPANLVQAVPSSMRLNEAPALGGLAQTALKMVDSAGVASGHRILVHGASGGVGIAALQLARARGATVIATCSTRNVDMVKDAGADQIIDYTTSGPLHDYFEANYGNHPLDSILDAVGSQDLYTHSPAYLKPDGTFVCVGSLEDKSVSQTLRRWAKNAYTPKLLGGVPRKFVMFGAAISPEGVKTLAETAEKSQLKVFVDSVFHMEDVLAGYERLQSKQVKGKVMIKVSTDEGKEAV